MAVRSRQAADRQSNARIAATASAGSATPSPRGLPSTPAGRPASGEYEGPIKHARDSGIRGIAMLRPSVVEAPEFVPNQQHWRGDLPRPMLLQVARGSVLIPWLNTAGFGT